MTAGGVFTDAQINGYKGPRRCEWCGHFIARDTPLTCWKVKVAPEYRQVPHSAWNLYARWLCPTCSSAASVRVAWSMPTEFAKCYGRFIAQKFYREKVAT